MSLPTLDRPPVRGASPEPARGSVDNRWSRRPDWLAWAGLIALAGLAGLLRLSQLGLTNFSRDDAWLLIYARAWIETGTLPLVGIGSSQGIQNGAVTVYLTALPLWLGGGAQGALAVVGVLHVLAVAATGWLIGRYFGRPAGLIAAAWFAVHPWSILYGRSLALAGFFPPFGLAYLACLFLAAVEGRRWALPVAGLLAGLLPQVHLGGIWLWPLLGLAVLLRRALWSWRLLAVTGVLLALPFGPWIVWNLQHGGADWTRLREYAAEPAQLWPDAWRWLWAMSGSDGYGGALGEAFERFVARGGLAPAPVDLLLRGALVLGVVVCLVGLRWPERLPVTGSVAPGRRGYLLALAWLLVVPVFLTRQVQSVFPHYVFLAFPAPLALMGIGLGTAGALAGRALGPRLNQRLGWLPPALLALLVGLAGAYQLRAYQAFLATYAEGGTQGGFGMPLDRQQAALDRAFALAGDRPVFLVANGDRPGIDPEATVWEYLRGNRPAKLIAGSEYLVYPGEAGAIYLIAPDLGGATPGPGLIEIPEAETRRPLDASGYRIFRGPAGSTVAAAEPFDAGRYEATAGPIRVLGQAAGGPWTPGVQQRVTVFWQPAGPQTEPYDLRLSLQLFDPAGRRIAQQDRLSYPATNWQAGELVLSFFDLPLPATASPGQYTLETSLYRADDLTRLDWTDPLGQNAGPVLRTEVTLAARP